MGRNYYLCKGYDTKNYKHCILTPIFFANPKIENIDSFTSQCEDEFALRKKLIAEKQINIKDQEDLVIARNETIKDTNQKRLVPIFNKRLIYKKDLRKLNLSGNTYQEWLSPIMKYLSENSQNEEFLNYMVTKYETRFSETGKNGEEKKNPPIIVGSLNVLRASLNDYPRYMQKNYNEFNQCWQNIIFKELFECQVEYSQSTDSSIYTPKIPIKIHPKGFHDMIINILDYIDYQKMNTWEYTEEETIPHNLEEQPSNSLTIEEEEKEEEFIYPEDMLRLLNPLAKAQGYDSIYDLIESENPDEYTQSVIDTGNRLVKRNEDGME